MWLSYQWKFLYSSSHLQRCNEKKKALCKKNCLCLTYRILTKGMASLSRILESPRDVPSAIAFAGVSCSGIKPTNALQYIQCDGCMHWVWSILTHRLIVCLSKKTNVGGHPRMTREAQIFCCSGIVVVAFVTSVQCHPPLSFTTAEYYRKVDSHSHSGTPRGDAPSTANCKAASCTPSVGKRFCRLIPLNHAYSSGWEVQITRGISSSLLASVSIK